MHAATAIKSHERDRLERLVRYMARPAISDERVSVVDENTIRLRLKTAWRDGTESLLFTPNEFIEKLIALVPIPRFHLTRYYGVLASRSRHRRTLPDLPQLEDVLALPAATLQGRGKSRLKKAGKKRLTWTALLKRTFKVEGRAKENSSLKMLARWPRCEKQKELFKSIFMSAFGPSTQTLRLAKPT